MARGPALTDMEKYAIRAMLEDGLTIAKIAAKTRRSESLVRKYIDNDLKTTEQFLEKDKDMVPPEVEKEVLKSLIGAGLTEFDAQSVINVVKKKFTKPVTIDDVEAMYKYCLNHKTPKDLFITKSEGGRKGIAVMTKGASDKMDAIRANRKPRDLSGHIFRQEDAE